MGEPTPEEIPSVTQHNETVQVSDLPTKKAQDFTRVYGSIVTVASRGFDMSLTFGEPITENANDAHVEQKVSVTMSWQAAKAFAHLLISSINNYENQVGEILLPSPLTPSDQPTSE